jgi:transposase InsO family protein
MVALSEHHRTMRKEDSNKWTKRLYLQRFYDIAISRAPQICPRASWPCKATTRPASTDPNFRSTHLPICEAFDFSSLKKERIKKKIYRTRELAQAEISDYIESFYNPTRRHSHLGGVSPEEFERAGRRRRRVH